MHHFDMLQDFFVAGHASVGAAASCAHSCLRFHIPSCRGRFARPFTYCRGPPAHSKCRSVQIQCSFASAVSHSSVTAQSVTEAVAKATLDKPLFQHALHSIFSSLAWFGLAWIITRYIGRKAKDCESPEASITHCVASTEKCWICHSKYVPFYRSQHQPSCQNYPPLCQESSGRFMSMLARQCWWLCMCLLQCFCQWQQWYTRSAP